MKTNSKKEDKVMEGVDIKESIIKTLVIHKSIEKKEGILTRINNMGIHLIETLEEEKSIKLNIEITYDKLYKNCFVYFDKIIKKRNVFNSTLIAIH